MQLLISRSDVNQNRHIELPSRVFARHTHLAVTLVTANSLGMGEHGQVEKQDFAEGDSRKDSDLE